MPKRRFVLLILTLSLAACASGGAGDPAPVVERYLRAKAASDAATIRALLCSEMEALLDQETNTFLGVEGVQIEGMTCARIGDTDAVKCAGKITARYGTETNEFPLVTYRVVQEDGEWKWCGETR